jgi:NADH-quinone oxidoreductase subunit E
VHDVRQDLSPLLAGFPREQRYLVPALQRVNEQLGYLPLWALEAVGEHLRVPRSEVHGVASHYPELRLEPPGRHLVRVCTGLSCQVVGGSAVQQALEQALDLRTGERRADGSLSFEPMPCAFLCSVAPLIEVDQAAHGGLDPERAAALVRRLVEEPA